MKKGPDPVAQEEVLKPVIAGFDFDGTITTRDTLIDFILFCFGKKRVLSRVAAFVPSLAFYVLGIISNHAAKEKLFSLFFSGMDEKLYVDLCTRYSLSKINRILNPAVVKKIKWHESQGHLLVIVSASMEGWIKPWAVTNSFTEIVATVPEVRNGILTGRFATENCHGMAKVTRFLERFPNRADYFFYFYGDSSGDAEIIDLADRGFYVGNRILGRRSRGKPGV
jgi:HAD superfamily hydrolase (TIGR01490 family)